MSFTTRSYAITVGTPQNLFIGQGEDRRFLLTFTEPGDSTPKNLTGLQAAVMSWRDKNGVLVIGRSYTPSASTLASGILAFDLVQSDTVAQAAQAYTADVWWEDADGHWEQILVASTGRILPSAFAPGEPVTTPPGVPVSWLAVLGVAEFPGPGDGSGPYEVTVTFPDLGLGAPHVFASQPVTDDTESIAVQVVAGSVSATSATVRANKDFVGYALVSQAFPS